MWFKRHARITGEMCAGVDLPSNPVFIVGLWRTGTTALHVALTKATGWTTPRTWQCFRPADFLLLPAPRRRQADRPMDAGVIDTYSPQEDEFAALLLGENSTYRAFIDPRRFAELEALLDEWRASMVAGAGTVPLSSQWEVFLRAVLAHSPGRLLLKSPNHTFRIPWLAMRFPNARFIWLTRRTSDVLRSNRRMWTAMAERYGQWRLDPAALDRFLQHALVSHDEILDWARRNIPERLFVTTFDDVIGRASCLTADILGHCNA